MNAIPRAVWTAVGVVVLVLGALLWLHLHDARVRETAQAQVTLAARADTIAAKDDTIHTLNRAIESLGKALKAVDSVWAITKATVVRQAYTPQSVRDSITALTQAVAAAEARGDTAVPIGIAIATVGELKVCRAQVDQIASAVTTMASECEARVAVRDGIIDSLKQVRRLQEDKIGQQSSQIAQLRALPGITSPRLVPFVDLNRSLARKSWEGDAGAKLRLFAQFHLQALARVGENLGSDSIGVRDTVPVMGRRHWDALVGGHYEFH